MRRKLGEVVVLAHIGLVDNVLVHWVLCACGLLKQKMQLRWVFPYSPALPVTFVKGLSLVLFGQ